MSTGPEGISGAPAAAGGQTSSISSGGLWRLLLAPASWPPRARTALWILLCGWLLLLHAWVILISLGGSPGLSGAGAVGDALLARTLEAGAANAVTAVVVSWRGFDTLGEVTVLFLAATGIGMLFAHRGAGMQRGTAAAPAADPSGHLGTEAPPQDGYAAPSEILTTGVRLSFPVLVLFGVYVVVHGHLSPGGGFQGGVIVATALLLRLLADRELTLHPAALRLTEALSGSGFVLVGLVGLALAGTATFLGNFLPHPAAAVGNLVSAGVIAPLYILVGLKVGAEAAAIFEDMLGHTDGGGPTP